jgi:hypothetical protein
MKLLIQPVSRLSEKQNAIRKAVLNSEHTLSAVSKQSGYHECTIRNWLRGSHEPLNVNFDNVMEAIKQLENVNTTHRIDWAPKVEALRLCRDKGLSVEQTAKEMGATYYSTVCAIHRYLSAA